MAKRFTSTDKWKDTWFQSLPLKYKCFWIYLLDECDNSGVWKPNISLAQFQIGEPFEEIEIKRTLADRIEVLSSGYWFISKFIEFQYGELSPDCKPHQSVIKQLKTHGIKGYTKGIHTLEDKEQEKDKVKEIGTGSHFILILPKELHSLKFKISGVIGLNEFYEMNMSQILQPEFAGKFMRDRHGKQFNDFKHVWNDYNDYIKKQFT